MLKPNFLLTKTISITVNRRVAGSYVNGDWVEGTTTPITRDVNIQPVKPHELMQFPESERSKEWYKVYCAEDLRTQQEGVGGFDADELLFEGKTFKVMKVYHFGMGTLDHHKAWAVRVELTPN